MDKVHAEKHPDNDTVLMEKVQEHEDNSGQEWEEQKTRYEKSVEER